jgi:hypothetical protein
MGARSCRQGTTWVCALARHASAIAGRDFHSQMTLHTASPLKPTRRGCRDANPCALLPSQGLNGMSHAIDSSVAGKQTQDCGRVRKSSGLLLCLCRGLAFRLEPWF